MDWKRCCIRADSQKRNQEEGRKTVEIERLDLIRWGKFSGHTIRLKSGVNIIYGGNESGKSTIHSFLGAMLSGTPQKAEKGRLASDTFLTGGDGEGAMTIWDGG